MKKSILFLLIICFTLSTARLNAYQVLRDDFNGPSYTTTGWVRTNDPHFAGGTVTFSSGYMEVSGVRPSSSSYREGFMLDKSFYELIGDFSIQLNMTEFTSQVRETFISIYSTDDARVGYYHIYDLGSPYDGKVQKRVYAAGGGATSFASVNHYINDTITFSRVDGVLTVSYGSTSITGSYLGDIDRIQIHFKGTTVYSYGTDRYYWLTVDDLEHTEQWGYIQKSEDTFAEDWEISEIDELYDLYLQAGGSVDIDGETWYYMDEDFSAQGYSLGDKWTDGDDFKYIYMGSGLTTNPDFALEMIPEPASIVLLLLSSIVGIIRKNRK